MTFTLTIKCDNAAFREDDRPDDNRAACGAEGARILHPVAEQVADGLEAEDYRLIFDVNGNSVGDWRAA